MCRQLLDGGYTVWVYDADGETMERFEETAARFATSLGELAVEAEVIFLSLPNSQVVEEVVLGEEGLIGKPLFRSDDRRFIELQTRPDPRR